MVIWINGAFGSGKTTAAFELHSRLWNSFVYDPENFGFFIRSNAPPVFEDDFQDIPLWREMNYKMLKLLSDRYAGVIIVPMTIVNPSYYDEIITRLIKEGHSVRHFILYASKSTILKRLRVRSARMLGRESFAVRSIDRCIYSFDNYITDEKIITDDMGIDSVVTEIAERCGVELVPDRRSRIRKLLDRGMVLIRHLR